MSPIVLLLAAMAFTGANVPIGKVIIANVPLWDAMAFRFLLATLALLPLAGRRGLQRLRGLEARDWLDILVLAGVGSVLFTLFILAGTKRTSASAAGIITATLPAVVALLASLVLRAKLSLPALLAVALAVSGLAVMQFGHAGDTGTLVGNGLVAAAVFCEATFVLVSRRISAQLSPIELSLAVSGVSALIAVPVAAVQFNPAAIAAIDPFIWLLIIWYALAASVFCTILWYAGVGRVAPWQAGIATTSLPLTALFVSVLALGETIDWSKAIGAVLVIAAIIVGALMEPARAKRRA